MRDIEGRYLSDNEIEAINSYLLQNGCSTINGTPNITNIHFTNGFYKTEFSEANKATLSYLEVPENWVKSFIRDKKINKIING